VSSCMTFSLGQSLLDLPQNSARRVALPFREGAGGSKDG
jgi:hypothetical protein